MWHRYSVEFKFGWSWRRANEMANETRDPIRVSDLATTQKQTCYWRNLLFNQTFQCAKVPVGHVKFPSWNNHDPKVNWWGGYWQVHWWRANCKMLECWWCCSVIPIRHDQRWSLNSTTRWAKSTGYCYRLNNDHYIFKRSVEIPFRWRFELRTSRLACLDTWFCKERMTMTNNNENDIDENNNDEQHTQPQATTHRHSQTDNANSKMTKLKKLLLAWGSSRYLILIVWKTCERPCPHAANRSA